VRQCVDRGLENPWRRRDNTLCFFYRCHEHRSCRSLSQRMQVVYANVCGTAIREGLYSVRIWHPEDRASWYILIIKPTRCTNFSNLFWNRNLHISDRFSVHHQESNTVYTATGICHTGYADCLLASSQHNLYDVYLTYPKHVEFYSKINLKN